MKFASLGRLVVAGACLSALPALAKEPVVWKNLKKLDDLAEKCEALGERKDIAGLRKIAKETKDAAILVEKDAPPANAADKEKVKTLQADLKSLTDLIDDPAKQDGEDLMGVLAGIHPVVEQLMEAAGMPHVHEEEPKKEGSPSGLLMGSRPLGSGYQEAWRPAELDSTRLSGAPASICASCSKSAKAPGGWPRFTTVREASKILAAYGFLPANSVGCPSKSDGERKEEPKKQTPKKNEATPGRRSDER